ncbi:hypothetical protein like AT4G00872 [Hibiscus trionum]|uniref:Pectinesterase inhibitor domain-containing protein n=1 Tax=Hibiscus trionum TaxID=183268 RepID=A0A9W7GVF3_HIBTR|nr:hypothetical protein like AT4G00872 [Hibiscus trionum]
MGIVLPLFLLSISFNYVGNRNLVLADESLIQLQCRNAEVPSTCIRCVESDPRGQSADKVTIAAIVISCISDSAETLSGNMSALIGPREDGGVKRALRNCVEGFSKAKADLTKATNMLENKDYDETNSLVNKALHQEIYCKQNLSEYHISYPSMDYDMTIYEELTDAAMRIVDRF